MTILRQNVLFSATSAKSVIKHFIVSIVGANNFFPIRNAKGLCLSNSKIIVIFEVKKNFLMCKISVTYYTSF